MTFHSIEPNRYLIWLESETPMLFNQPVFAAVAGTWDSADINLADIGSCFCGESQSGVITRRMM